VAEKTSPLKPKQLLTELSRRMPTVWEQIKRLRKGKGKDLPDWPEWCYMPIAGGYAIATDGGPPNANLFDPLLSPASITALATWRVSQGVYRFDADLFNSLVAQPLESRLPCEVFKRLPEWCVYIETYGLPFLDVRTEGFFAHLECDANDGRTELRLLLVPVGSPNTPLSLHLGDWTLDEGLRRMWTEAEKNIHGSALPPNPPFEKRHTDAIVPLLQLLLYLCADNADVPVRPEHPSARTRMSGQVDVPRDVRLWTVGERIGAGIRKYRNEHTQQLDDGGEPPVWKDGFRHSPRPHVRRAHWHHFWTGPKTGERKLMLRWLPPIPVKYNEVEGPVVIHKVYRP